RSQPYAAAMRGPSGSGPGYVTSVPSGAMFRITAKRSASSVVDDTHSRSITGPVTSMSVENGAVENTTVASSAPRSAEYVADDASDGRSIESERLAASR